MFLARAAKLADFFKIRKGLFELAGLARTAWTGTDAQKESLAQAQTKILEAVAACRRSASACCSLSRKVIPMNANGTRLIPSADLTKAANCFVMPVTVRHASCHYCDTSVKLVDNLQDAIAARSSSRYLTNSSQSSSSTISPGVPLGMILASPTLRGNNSAGSKAFPK